MSKNFDELARALARPMGRRRAVRLLGGVAVAAILPSLRPREAAAGGAFECPTGTVVCTNGKGSTVCRQIGGACCIFPELVVGCRRGYQCGPNDQRPCICNGVECGDRCCPRGKDCEDGKCVDCRSEDKCGSKCCRSRDGDYCASKTQSVCCKQGENACAVFGAPGTGGKAGRTRCCPKGTRCCANDKRTDCCGGDQVCRSGKCACPPKTKECGADCCKTSKGEHCSNGLCCPKGKVNCGGKCCDERDCCGKDFKTCCSGNTICLNGTCCPIERGVGSGRNARCCPPGTVPTPSGDCCRRSDPNCCSDDDGITLSCLGTKVCVEGTCRDL